MLCQSLRQKLFFCIVDAAPRQKILLSLSATKNSRQIFLQSRKEEAARIFFVCIFSSDRWNCCFKFETFWPRTVSVQKCPENLFRLRQVFPNFLSFQPNKFLSIWTQLHNGDVHSPQIWKRFFCSQPQDTCLSHSLCQFVKKHWRCVGARKNHWTTSKKVDCWPLKRRKKNRFVVQTFQTLRLLDSLNFSSNQTRVPFLCSAVHWGSASLGWRYLPFNKLLQARSWCSNPLTSHVVFNRFSPNVGLYHLSNHAPSSASRSWFTDAHTGEDEATGEHMKLDQNEMAPAVLRGSPSDRKKPPGVLCQIPVVFVRNHWRVKFSSWPSSHARVVLKSVCVLTIVQHLSGCLVLIEGLSVWK